MEYNDRGKVNNRKLAAKPKDYSGLRYENITPTDIDGMIEYHDKAFVYFETKYNDSQLPYGQRLALERNCDDHKKPTLLIISSHTTEGDRDIDMAGAIVVEYRSHGKWFKPDGTITTRQLTDCFLKRVDRGEI